MSESDVIKADEKKITDKYYIGNNNFVKAEQIKKKLNLENKLGEGGFGTVYSINDKDKVVKIQRILGKNHDIYVNDIINLERLKFDFVPKIYGIELWEIVYDDDSENISGVKRLKSENKSIRENEEIIDRINKYDYNSNNDLLLVIIQEKLDISLDDKLLKDKIGLKEYKKLNEETMKLIKEFHNKGYIHLDFKPNNVMIKKEGTILNRKNKLYLIDFTFTKKLNEVPDEYINIYSRDFAEYKNDLFIKIYKIFDYVYYYKQSLKLLRDFAIENPKIKYVDYYNDLRRIIKKEIEELEIVENNKIIPILLYLLSKRMRNQMDIDNEYILLNLGINVNKEMLQQERKILLLILSEKVKEIYYMRNSDKYSKDFKEGVKGILKELGANFKLENNEEKLKDEAKKIIMRINYLDKHL